MKVLLLQYLLSNSCSLQYSLIDQYSSLWGSASSLSSPTLARVQLCCLSRLRIRRVWGKYEDSVCILSIGALPPLPPETQNSHSRSVVRGNLWVLGREKRKEESNGGDQKVLHCHFELHCFYYVHYSWSTTRSKWKDTSWSVPLFLKCTTLLFSKFYGTILPGIFYSVADCAVKWCLLIANIIEGQMIRDGEKGE